MLEMPVREQSSTKTVEPLRTNHCIPEPFVFVPITGAEASKGRGAAKQIVRAHVTRVQHAKSSTPSYRQNLESWTVNPQIHRQQSSLSESQFQTSKTPTPPKKSVEARKKNRKAATAAANAATATKSAIEEDVEEIVRQDEPRGVVARSQVPKIPGAKRAGAARQDPFWSYPVDYQPYLPAIFAHYIENVAVEIPDLDSPNHRGLLRHR